MLASCSTGLGETATGPTAIAPTDPPTSVTVGDPLGGTEGPGDPGGESTGGPDTTTTVGGSGGVIEAGGGEGAEAANAAVPAGVDLSFATEQLALDDDGGYGVLAVAPVGWEHSSFLGVTLEPPADADVGFFTSLELSTGCDGLCAPTDWEERLNGPDGYLTMRTDNADVVEQRDVDGSEGTELITEDSFGTRVLVLRWDDSADHYFKCEATLDEDDVALVQAFSAACRASTPDWIRVG